MKDVLLIGGLGFVGTQVCQELESTNLTFDIFDNYMSGPIETQHHVINADIRDREALFSVIPHYKTIVHLAGIVGAPACSLDEELSYTINVKGTQNILGAMDTKQRLIFISSTSAYGKQHTLVTEDTPLVPLTNYGEHKAQSELDILASDIKHIIVRPATAFGTSKRIRVDLLPNTLAYIAATKGEIDLFEPEVIRPFIHVKDFARVLVYALQGKMPWNTVYNIGDPALTMRKCDLAAYITSVCNARLTLREGTDPDQRNYDVSFERLLNTEFTFTENALLHGITQILNASNYIQSHYEQCCTPFSTQQFILKEATNRGIFN